ncbi:protein peste-like [Armigeres subalbatus]|uniref:protein peste-like n=1 Tax=Armigeres subalbatus TaxID=124917 RepID=UPI002ED2B44B
MRVDKFLCVAAVGGVLTLAGAIFALFWGDILDAIIVKEKVLTPTSRTFKLWRRPTVPIKWTFTLFNWTNAEAYLANEATKPAFSEVGPFLYSEILEKIDARFNTKNSTISFRRRSYFTPDVLLDGNLLEQSVTNINVVALTAANRGNSGGYGPARGISFALYNLEQNVLVTQRASELLFDGYPEPMIQEMLHVLEATPQYGQEVDDRFSWFRAMNGSKKFHGFFNMDSGKEDASRYGLIRQWNYRDRATIGHESCATYEGFAGELFPTKIRSDQVLRVFLMELCRAVVFEFDREEEILGVVGYRFVANERTVDDVCNKDKQLLPRGAINITDCRDGAPFYASFPHFYAADGFYGSGIEGMNPDGARHQSFITIEPKSGTVLRSSIRLQINALLQRYGGIALYQDAPRSYVPLLWYSKSFDLPQEEIVKLRSLLDVSQLGYLGGFVVAVLGLVMAMLAIGLKCVIRATQRKSKANSAPVVNGDARGEYECVQNEQNKEMDRIKL